MNPLPHESAPAIAADATAGGQPPAYSRRILLAVTGLSPQVVTETLYALAQQQEPLLIPSEVHLVTTAEGAERARLALLSERPGWFRQLLLDYDLPSMRFDNESIHVLTDQGGQPLADIRTLGDNERAADFLIDTVRQLTQDEDSALHVSIAGGRKTMGYYAGYALSLYGRPQDKLSHVLVTDPFESSWDFFYPTPYESIITTRDNKLANCAEAQITLAEIPFIRLREELPKRFLSGRARFTEIVTAANRALEPPQLKLDIARRQIMADDQPIELGPTEFAVVLWLAERAREDAPEVDWTTPEAVNEFLAAATRVINPYSGDYARLEDALGWRAGSTIKTARYFEPQKSRINSALEHSLGKTAGARYAIARTGSKGASRYFLPLAPEAIEIHN